MTALIFVLLFLICWFALMINWIKLMIVKTRLRKDLNSKYPELTNNLSFNSEGLIPNKVVEGSSIVFKYLISLGSTKASIKYVSFFVDIEKIVQTKDLQLIKQMEKLIRLNSIFPKIWIAMIASLILAFVFWPEGFA